MACLRIKQILSLEPNDQELTARGWIRTARDSKEFAFVELNDGSCLANIQVFIDKKDAALSSSLGRLATGASLEVSGALVRSP
jgi:asparaginyl-tRNA synthetase